MEKLRILTRNDRDYQPTLDELRINDEEFNLYMQTKMGQRIHQDLVDAWIVINIKRIDKLEERRARLAISKSKALEDHWYNTLEHSIMVEAIDKTRSRADEVINAIVKVQTKQCFIEYFERMRWNVKHSDIKLVYSDNAKLTRFPKYNKFNNILFGSNARMIALWSHVFSLRNK